MSSPSIERSTDDRVEDLRRAAGRDVGALGDVRADREERGVEPALLHGFQDVGDLAVQLQADAELRECASISASSTSRGRRYFGNAEAHHAARDRAGLVDLDRVPEAREVVGRRQARRPGAHDEHSLAR